MREYHPVMNTTDVGLTRGCVTNTTDADSITHIEIAFAHLTSATRRGCIGH